MIKKILLLVVLLIAGGAVWVGSALPQMAGQAKLPGLSGEARVYRDENGIPHIFANTLYDAYRALGYCHAQDRLFQMEMTRRAASGRLSEVLGADLLKYDRRMRALNFAGLAKTGFAAMGPEPRAALEAYAEGVNAYVQNHKGAWPPEFLLLGMSPSEWQPSDGLLWGKLMAWQLSSDLANEVFRLQLQKKGWPMEAIKALAPPLGHDAPVTLEPFEWIKNHSPQLAKVYAPAEAGAHEAASRNVDGWAPFFNGAYSRFYENLPNTASNIFVLSGARTKSGKPILANDPHLQLQSPALWYLASISTPEGRVKGATVAGMPFFVLGQNAHIAWGFTTSSLDVQDLVFVPESNLATRHEIIHVKGAPDDDFAARSADGLPVVSDVMADVRDITPDDHVAVLNYTGLAPDDRTAEALWVLSKATSLVDAAHVFDFYRAPTQNLMVADDAGQVGYFAVGAIPKRKADNDGYMPRVADKASAWDSVQPFADIKLINPSAGAIINANNAITGEKCAGNCADAHVNAEPYRAMRLEALLQHAEKMDVAQTGRVMTDVVSSAAQQMLPKLLAAAPHDDQPLVDGLAGWDGTMHRNDWQPLFFHMWMEKLTAQLFGKEALSSAVWPRFWALQAALGQATPAMIAQSFSETRAELTKRYGSSPTGWRWGLLHQAKLAHPVWSKVPGLADIFALGTETDGDNTTVNRAGADEYDGDAAFADDHGAAYRAAYDLAEPDNSLFILAGGQSGIPFAKHYGDLVPLWARGGYIQIKGSEDELAAMKADKLVLTP